MNLTAVQQYSVVTFSYWGFTLTDGALRMLVILYFHQLGYSPLDVASIFLLYECCGVVTNLMGGWLATHIGLNKAMQLGLLLQIISLCLLLVNTEQLSIIYAMCVQALSGIGKDLNKMSAKSSIKMLLPENAQGKLYQWVAMLTGSKNTLKGIGFFMGAFLLDLIGFHNTLMSMAIGLGIVFLLNSLLLREDLGKLKLKAKVPQLFSHSSAVNYLSAARLFLFGSRDIWFVIALPVFLQEQLQWSHTQVGSLLAVWVIAYGILQSLAPLITRRHPDGRDALWWSVLLAIVPLMMVLFMPNSGYLEIVLITGLFIFGAVFAINSAVHSYLIVAYAKQQTVAMDVGFYYMANALGRLVGTLLSGWVYQSAGLIACLEVTFIFIVLTSIISIALPRNAIIKI